MRPSTAFTRLAARLTARLSALESTSSDPLPAAATAVGASEAEESSVPHSSSNPGKAAGTTNAAKAAVEESVTEGRRSSRQQQQGTPKSVAVYQAQNFQDAAFHNAVDQWPAEVGPHQTLRVLFFAFDLTRIFGNRFGRPLSLLAPPVSRPSEAKQWTVPRIFLPWGADGSALPTQARQLQAPRYTPYHERDFFPCRRYTSTSELELQFRRRVTAFELAYVPLHLSLGWVQDHFPGCPNRAHWLEHERLTFMLQRCYQRRCQCRWEPSVSYVIRPHRRERMEESAVPPSKSGTTTDLTAPFVRVNPATGSGVLTQSLGARKVKQPQLLVMVGGQSRMALEWLDCAELLYDFGLSLSKAFAAEQQVANKCGSVARDCWNVEINVVMVETPGYGVGRGSPSTQAALDAAVEAVRNEIAWYGGCDVEVHMISYGYGSVFALRLARMLVEARVLASQGIVGCDADCADLFNDPVMAKGIVNTMIFVSPIAESGGTVFSARSVLGERKCVALDTPAGRAPAAKHFFDNCREMAKLLELVVINPNLYYEFMIGILAGKDGPFYDAAQRVLAVAEEFSDNFAQVIAFYKELPGDSEHMFMPAFTLKFVKALLPLEEWFAYGETPIYFEPPAGDDE